MENKEIFTKTSIISVAPGATQKITGPVIVENKVTLNLNGAELVSFMCLPEKLKQLAAGFLFGEGFIKSKSNIENITVGPDSAAIDVKAKIVEGSRERFIKGRTILSGCSGGVSAADIKRPSDCKQIDTSLQVESDTVSRLVNVFQKHSTLHSDVGGVHSAALAQVDGIQIYADDIGRHNAVDKVIGEAMLTDYDCSDKILLVTGRISSEITIKAILRKIPLLISLASPTALSLRLAEEYFLTLVGKARGKRFKIYTHPERVLTPL